jgi:hypothetical protein
MLRRKRLWLAARIPTLVALVVVLACGSIAVAGDEDGAPPDGPEIVLDAGGAGKEPKDPAAGSDTPPAGIPAAQGPTPKTRFTVRRQIESVEPAGWMRRFGRVVVRPLEP